MYAKAILAEYDRQGYKVTVRQLYYQFVARDLFPEDRRWLKLETGKWIRDPNGIKNAPPNYKWLGSIINDARLAGFIDWSLMEDRTRDLSKMSVWETPLEIVEACANQYKIDKWENQPYRPQVWIEKEALIGIVKRACKPYDVRVLPCRGYMSQSAMWKSYRMMRDIARGGQIPLIIHLGDHDPSGIDMTRDNEDRMRMMMGGYDFEIRRIALNMDQVRKYDPPPDYAKPSDSRSDAYIEEYGDESWELDALQPQVMVDLIREAIEDLLDPDAWQDAVDDENCGKEDLKAAVKFMSKRNQH